MWTAIFGTIVLVGIVGGITLGVFSFWYDLKYGCKHEFTKTVDSGNITVKKSEYSSERIVVGKYFVRECSKCGYLKRFNCD